MSDEIFFGGAKYISAQEAASSSDLTRDYITRLCRDGKIKGRQIGKNWYVSEPSFKQFLIHREYQASERREALTETRIREYRESDLHSNPTISRSPISESLLSVSPLSAAAVSETAKNGTEHIKTRLSRALASSEHSSAMHLLQAPSGMGSALLSAAHVPVYTLTPAMEFAHKLIALVLAFTLVFGTLSLVDPSYARYAADSARDQARTIAGAVSNFDAPRTAQDAGAQIAAVAANPEGLLSEMHNLATSASGALGAGWGAALGSFGSLASRFVFPTNTWSSFGAPGGTVAVTVAPYQTPITLSSTFATVSSSTGSSLSRTPIAQTIITNPVVERVIETQTIMPVAGLTEATLDQKLGQLDNKLSSQIYSLTSANSTAIAQNYAVTAQTNAIDQLSGTSIQDPSITGGSISGAGIDATTLSVSGDTTLNGDLTLAGALSIATSSGGLTTGDLNAVNATATTLFVTNASTTNATSTNLFATLSNFTSSVIDNLSATLASIDGLTATNATTTNATSTNLYAANLEFVNSSSTNATSTNLFADTASSTNLFATNATFGTINSNDFSSQGNGYFAGGLGVGVATTTSGVLQTTGDAWIGGNLVVAGNSTVLGNSTTIGNSSAGTLVINSSIKSSIIPDQNITYDLGSPSFFWRDVYIDNLHANNISAASTTIAGTESSDFTINSDNVSSDNEDAQLIFFRGIVNPNALLSWNSSTTAKRFEFNQPLFIQNASASTTEPTLALQSVAGQTANILQIASSSGATLASIQSDGGATFASILLNGSTTLQNFTFANATGTNATTTNFFSTTASSTNLFAQTASLGTLNLASTLGVAGLATFSTGFLANASSTITSGLFSANGGASTTNITAIGTGYFGNGAFTASSGTSTIAAGQGFTIGGSQFVLQQGSGNVGIGTSSPQSSLFVNSNYSSGNNIATEIEGQNSSNTGSTILRLQNYAGVSNFTNADIELNAGVSGFRFGSAGGDLNIVNDGPTGLGGAFNKINFVTTNNSRVGSIVMSIGGGGAGANVGIGTTSPFANLSVQNNFGNQNTTIFSIASSTASDGSASTPFLTVTSAGNVGVGTAGPGRSLDVGLPSGATSTGYASVGNMLLSQLDNGAYFGRTRITENQFGIDPSTVGAVWTQQGTSQSYNDVAMSSNGRYETAVAGVGYIYVSSDYGVTWAQEGTSQNYNGIAVSSDGKYQTAVVRTGYIYTSTDYGATWTQEGTSQSYNNVSMSVDGKYQTAVSGGLGSGFIYVSTNYGATWTQTGTSQQYQGVAVSSDGKYQTVDAYGNYIYISTNYGSSWTQEGTSQNYAGVGMSADGKYQTATVFGGYLYTSSNYGVTWTQEGASTHSYYGVALSSDGRYQVVTAGGATNFFGFSSNFVYVSTNYGATWTQEGTNQKYSGVAMSSDGKYVAFGVNGGYLYTSVANSYLTGGNLGLGTTTPYSNFSIQNNYGSTNSLLLTVASSTANDASASTPFLTVSNAGLTTLLNLSAANATTTNFFSTTASSTNLFAQTASLGTLNLTGLATLANGFVSQASSTVVGNFTATGLGSFATLAATQTSGTSTIASGQGFTVGGSQLVLQQGSGNVGIGTASPGATLAVNGTSFLGTNQTNYLTVSGASTAPFIQPGGAGTDIDLQIKPKGNGQVLVGPGGWTYNTQASGAGSLFLSNGTNDTPNLKFAYANHSNFGVDSAPGGLGNTSGQIMRFISNSDETGGLVVGALDSTGNFAAATGFSAAAGTLFMPSWTTTGRQFAALTDTLVDNTSNATTIGTRVANSFAAPTFAFSIATSTITNAATVYISGAPSADASSSVITNSFALDVAGGTTRLGGSILAGGPSFTKSNLGAGEIALDNGSTDTPGLHFYNGNNSNYGIDVASGFMRIVNNLDESGGNVLATLNTNGLGINNGNAGNGSGIGLLVGSGKVGLGTTTPFANLSVQNNYGSTNSLLFTVASSTNSGGSAANSFFAVTSGGNVGIGTTSPYAALSIATGASNPIILGRDTGAVNYNTISLNGQAGEWPNAMGISGGGVNDQTLYVNAPTFGSIVFRPKGVGGNATAPVTSDVIFATSSASFYFGGTNPFVFCQDSGATAYNSFSLNGNCGEPPTSLGLTGGGTTDPQLYVNAPTNGGFVFRPNGQTGGIGANSQFTNITSTALYTGSGVSIGVGTSSPYANLSVQNDYGNQNSILFTVASSTNSGGSASNPFLTVTSGGNVGIGTAAPQASLQVVFPDSGTNYGLILQGGRTAGPNGILFRNSFWTNNNSAGGAAITAVDDTHQGMTLNFGTTLDGSGAGATPTTQMTILNNGLVGIGTTTPYANLSVQNNFGNQNSILFDVASSTNSGGTASNPFLTVTSSGNVGIGTASPGYNLQGANETMLTLAGTNGAGIELTRDTSNSGYGNGEIDWINTNNTPGSNQLLAYIQTLTAGGSTNKGGDLEFATKQSTVSGLPVERMRITNAGNVGIGTSSPLTKLSIQGTAGANDLLNVASSTGASALYVNAAGNVGIGTASPGAQLTVSGSGGTTQGSSQVLITNSNSSSARALNIFQPSLGVGNSTWVNLGTGDSSKNSVTWGFQEAGAGSNSNLAYFGFNSQSSLFDMTAGGAVYFPNPSGGNVGVGTTTPYANFSVQNNYGSTNSLLFTVASSTNSGGSASNPFLTVTSGGNVGIGTAGPTTQLTQYASSGFVADTIISGASNWMGMSANSASQATIGYGGSDLSFGTIGNTSWGGYLEKMRLTTGGNLALGTTTPYSNFTIQNDYGTLNTNLFLIASSTASNGSSASNLFSIDNVGDVSALVSTATTTIAGGLNVGSGGLQYTAGSGITSIGSLQTGNFSFDSDAGMVSWADMPVTSASANGTIESYTASLNSNPALTVYSTANGSGGLNALAVGVGTTSPYATLAVQNQYGLTSPFLFTVASSTSSTGSSATNFLTVTNAGNVGIGTTTPLSTLTVVGSGCFGGTSGVTVLCGTTAGDIYYRAAATGNYDVAENYASSNTSLLPGNVVALDTSTSSTVKLAQSGDSVLGVVSTNPGLLLGGADASASQKVYPIALSGRVPVQVSLANGPVAIGDRLALSTTTPGVAVKAVGDSWSIGVALDSYTAPSASSTVMMFVEGQYYFAPNTLAAISALVGSSTSPSSSSGGILSGLFSQLAQWFASAANGIGDFFANRVIGNQLCAKKSDGTLVCVTGDQLAAVVAGTGGSTSGASGGSTSSSTPSDSTSTPPILSVNGNNPATVNVGATYADLGASITGPVADLNLGIVASVDGGASTTLDKIAIDTSVAGAHTIQYSATDQNGLTGYASRTVNVTAASSQSTAIQASDASSTPSISDASSTSSTSDASSTSQTSSASSTQQTADASSTDSTGSPQAPSGN